MRIVVKIGTSTLAHPGGRLNIRHTEALVKVWSDIKNAGHELIIVSSGATGLGSRKRSPKGGLFSCQEKKYSTMDMNNEKS